MAFKQRYPYGGRGSVRMFDRLALARLAPRPGLVDRQLLADGLGQLLVADTSTTLHVPQQHPAIGMLDWVARCCGHLQSLLRQVLGGTDCGDVAELGLRPCGVLSAQLGEIGSGWGAKAVHGCGFRVVTSLDAGAHGAGHRKGQSVLVIVT